MGRGPVSPDFKSGETAAAVYFFACLAATACFFLLAAVLALDCFCVDFFWLDFGDRSPIILIFFRGLIHLRHGSFSEGRIIMLSPAAIVNDGREIIWRIHALPPFGVPRLRGAEVMCRPDRTA